MGDDNDPPKNPFIRWKQHVDTHIGMTLHGLLGIPSMVSKNMNLQSDVAEPRSSDAAGGSAPNSNTATTTNTEPAASDSPSPSSNDALDGVDPNQLLAWHKFIYYSPYSPLQLQQEQQLHLVPPPVPRDVPFGADPYSFTYADAFEDLLRADSGRPLLDLADRSFRNVHMQMRSGSAMEPPYVFFHRMHSQGLLDAYFPRTTAAAAASALARTEAREGQSTDDSIVRAVAALAEQDSDLWRAQMVEEDADKHYDVGEDEHEHESGHGHGHDDRYDDDYHDQGEDEARRRRHDAWAHHDAEQQRRRQQAGFGGGGLFDELDRVFRVLGRIIDEETNGGAKKDDDGMKDNSQPNGEDELYDAVRSAYSSAENSLSTLIKTFSGGSGFDSRIDSQIDSQIDAHRWPDAKQDKLETTQSTEEHTDVFGNRHVKTVVRRVDADGNEVSRETRYTVRSPTPQELAIRDVDDLDDQQQEQPSQQQQDGEKVEKLEAPKPRKPVEKPSGWFWK